MATKPLKTITFEGLEDTYTIPQVDDTLSVTGASADAKVTGDSLKAKAEAEGMVSMAKALVGGKYTLDQSPYHYRQSPEAGALDEKIVGGTLGWNQLVIAKTRTDTNNGITYTYDPDGSVIVNGTATANSYSNIGSILHGINNHVMVMSGCPSGGSADTYRLRDGYVAGKYDTGNGFLWKKTNDNFIPQLVVDNGVTVSNLKFVPQAIDLTTLFGSTIADYIYSLEQSSAGAGVAWVKRYIDLDTYHEYDAGSIQSVEGLVSHDVVGFNQWDEEWEIGVFNNNRVWVPQTAGYVGAKNPIKVLGDTTYYIKCPVGIEVNFYDSNGSFISNHSIGGNSTFATPSNAKTMRFRTYTAYGQTYNHDICINISDPSRNGEYEPYEKHSYPLDSTLELMGIPKLSGGKMYFDGDWYQSDGQVRRRYGIVDLGTLTWYLNGAFYAVISDAKSRFEGVCSRYPRTNRSVGEQEDKTWQNVSGAGLAIWIKDTSYSTVADLKAAMSGVMLVYELATPTTESAQPYQSPQLAGSTEEYVTSGVVPVGHESRYYEDITGKVNDLPSDFSTLIAPVEKSFTATRNYTVGSFVIVNNQLYKVSSAISSGGTITPNSNVTATTIMAEILALA